MGGKRTKRVRLATGIYSDAWGVSVIFRGKEQRYPLGTPLDELRRDRRELVDAAGAAPARRGTLAAAVTAYLETIPEGSRRRDVRTMLQHWLDAGLGPLALDAVTPLELRKQLAAWPKFSPKTKNPGVQRRQRVALCSLLRSTRRTVRNLGSLLGIEHQGIRHVMWTVFARDRQRRVAIVVGHLNFLDLKLYYHTVTDIEQSTVLVMWHFVPPQSSSLLRLILQPFE